MNNPLMFTDPTGFSWWTNFRDKIIRPAAAIAAAYFVGPWVTNAFFSAAASAAGAGLTSAQVAGMWSTAQIVGGAAGGFAAGLVGSGGDLRAGAIGAISGGMFGWAGGVGGVDGAASAGRYAAHASAGCVSGELGGGGCARGAASAVAGKWATNATQGNLVASVVAGGTVSVIGGGKFANGAATAAFGYMFNCVAHKCNVADYGSKDSNFHEYGPFPSSVCDTAKLGCLDAARQQLQCASAPGQGSCAVVGTELSQGLTGGNSITQYAPNRDMVINGTSPGHLLHDGYVVRWLSVNNAGIAQIWTYGRGVNTNFLTTFGNQYGGEAIFKYIGIRNSAEANKAIRKD